MRSAKHDPTAIVIARASVGAMKWTPKFGQVPKL